MNRPPSAVISGIYEIPTRLSPDKSVAMLHAEAARGALDDAGLTHRDVDAYFCAGDAPGFGPVSMADYLGLKLRYADSTEFGGASYISHVARAAAAIEAGRCDVALITLAGRPRSEGRAVGTTARTASLQVPDTAFEMPYKSNVTTLYGMSAKRHMHEWGTTSEQLAWIRVAASHHAQHNPHALLRKTVSVQDVLDSPIVADPLHRLDCCVVTDGGGAIVVSRREVARDTGRKLIAIRGAGDAIYHQRGGAIDLTTTGAAESGRIAFSQAGLKPDDIQYASIYDSFTITVLLQLEDLGFCAKGEGGKFVADGNLISGVGRLPFNTDGGGQCNNHPANRGGLTKVIEAVRQLRGEAHPAVQVPGCQLAVAQGIGGWVGTRHASSTLIMERI